MGGGMSIEMYLAEREERVDADLQERVWDELHWQPDVDSSNLVVEVADRTAMLAGTVENCAQKLAAEHAARRTPGLQAVHSSITVALPADACPTDEQLAAEVREALARHALLPHDAIEVSVDGGRVRLAGEVPTGALRRAAEQAVELLVGVRGVDNLIAVRPAVAPPMLQTRVEEALRRDPELAGDRITVEVIDDVVTLKGRVRSLAEADEADRAVAVMPGVRAVQDSLEVRPA